MSNVSFRQYALATWIGLIPGILLYVYVGASLRPLAEAVAEIEDPTPEPIAFHIFFWFGLAATLILTIVSTRIARKALAATSSEPHDPPLAVRTPADAPRPS